MAAGQLTLAILAGAGVGKLVGMIRNLQIIIFVGLIQVAYVGHVFVFYTYSMEMAN